ncbi:MAG: amidohydrolase family protein [Muribaculaceae bacterium]|nr:amidohydrolase family protein [Muribaculaceae bacterium]
MKLYKANIIFTREKDHFEVVEHGYVGVENGRVVDVASSADAFGVQPEEVIDYGDSLLIPAMNDMHVHAGQYRNQGISMDMELLEWLNSYTFPEEAKYSDMRYARRMYSRFVHDLWRYGTMRTATFATTHLESTRLLMELFREAGMGALVGKVNMDRNSIDALLESVDEAVARNEALITEWNDPDGLVRPIITPRFIPSCSPAMLRACGEQAQKYQVPVQSHLSENPSEIVLVQRLEPESRFYGDAYDRYGLFGQTPTIMAHCVFSEGEELELMSRRNVMVAHCPTSNINLKTSIAPIRSFLDKGIKVGFGSDISGGHDMSIMRVMVYAIQVSKLYDQKYEGKHFLTLPEAFWIATKSAGSFFGRVGSFEPGYEFDALVIDDSDLNHGNYTLTQRLERFIYVGDDRHIAVRFCRGQEIPEPRILD